MTTPRSHFRSPLRVITVSCEVDALITYDPPVASLQNIPTYSDYAERQVYLVHPDIALTIRHRVQDVIRETVTELEPEFAPRLRRFLTKDHTETLHVFEMPSEERRHHFYLASEVVVQLSPSSELTLSGFLVVQPKSEAGSWQETRSEVVSKTGNEVASKAGSAVYHYRSVVKTVGGGKVAVGGDKVVDDGTYGTFTPSDAVTAVGVTLALVLHEIWKALAHPEQIKQYPKPQAKEYTWQEMASFLSHNANPPRN
ncbi:hypothetical protein C8R42DRAFT_648375 [Lentinula raphanica]|nr:hypothetical protein C8R42DRAFT_648375 [Lentinula raphanica]